MKKILCCRMSPENIKFLKQLSQEKDRSVSFLIDKTISDMKAYKERKQNDNS
jgi:hypothetical protein